MAQIAADSPGAFCPHWAEGGNSLGTSKYSDFSEPTWMNFNQTIAHPLDTAGYCVEMDLSQTNTMLYAMAYTREEVGSDIGQTTPSSAVRWGRRWVMYIYIPTATTLTSAVYIYRHNVDAGPCGVKLATDLTLSLEVPAGTAFLANGTGGTAKTLSKDTWYGIEIWFIEKDSAGNTLTHDQWVLRVWDSFSSGNPPTVTTVCNGSKAHTATLGWQSVTIGDADGAHAAASGSGLIYFTNFYGAWEDADNPFGVIRVLYKAVSGAGADTGWTGTTIDWDDVPPNDITDFISSNSTTEADESQDIAGSSAQITNSDTVIHVTGLYRIQNSSDIKGDAGSNFKAYISDGTNKRVTPRVDKGDTTWVPNQWCFTKTPSGGTWDDADIDNNGDIELGMRGNVDDTGTTARVSAVACMIAWQKAGETVAAVPNPPSFAAQKHRTMKALLVR